MLSRNGFITAEYLDLLLVEQPMVTRDLERRLTLKDGWVKDQVVNALSDLVTAGLGIAQKNVRQFGHAVAEKVSDLRPCEPPQISARVTRVVG